MSKREDIKYQIKALGIRENWLAHQLGMKKSVLLMLLNEEVDFDNDLYKNIKSIIETYQFDLNLIEEVDDDNEFNLFDGNLKKGISNRLRIFAKRKFGTLKNLSEAMDISPQQLQQYVGAKREPGAKILSKLLKVGCNINWLLGGSDSIDSYKIYQLENKLRNCQNKILEISNICSNSEKKHRGFL